MTRGERRAVQFWPAVLVVAGLSAACSDDSRDARGAGARSGSGGGSEGGSAGDGVGGEGGEGGRAGEGGGASGASGASGDGGDGGAGGLGEGGAAGEGQAGSAGAPFRHPPYGPSPYPEENLDSDEKAMLGKILFWDEQLGGDDTVACGTCHRPSAGGSDPRSSTPPAFLPGPDEVLGTADDVHGSLGVVRCNAEGVTIGEMVQVTGRKAPTYLDAMFAPRLFWDGRAECRAPGCPSFSAFEDPDNPGTFPIRAGAALENQAIGPPLSAVEMACEEASWAAIHAELRSAAPLLLAREIPAPMAEFIAGHEGSYPRMFAAAFGQTQTSGPEDEINTRRIAFAIATHERRLRSDQTPWDLWNAGDDAALTPAQVRGFELFLGKARCELCHRVPTFSDGDFHFIGFHKPAWDLGRNAINDLAVPGAIRTPTLRNIGLREATGMLHRGAGVGASMEALVELYVAGGLVDDPDVVAAPISPTMKLLDLTLQEQADLVDFMRNGLDDPRVAAEEPPFDRPRLSTE